MRVQFTCPECGVQLLAAEASRCPACLCWLRNDGDPAGKLADEDTRRLLEMVAGPSTGTRALYFEDYELLGEIARGGMGVIHRARQISLDRMVALKMILSGQVASEEEVRRFLREAKAIGHLRHPNIVTVYEVGENDGHHFFSMELVNGTSLAEQVETGRWKLDDGKEAARLTSKVARALDYAHKRGVLHRDLKPANILIDAEGEPHVADFGLARRVQKDSSFTADGSILGTPSYMPPEQASGKSHQFTPAVDIYSLGAILYYLLTGRPPFVASTPLDTMVQVVEGDVVLPRNVNALVDADLQEICLRCLEKAPEDRYPTAAALADDLERFCRDEPVEIRAASFTAKLRMWARRQPVLVARLAGLGACTLISELIYQIKHHLPLITHVQTMTVLVVWILASILYQRLMDQKRWSDLARTAWAITDVVCLTAVLFLDGSLNGPLMTCYPALVAASGLWFRIRFVVLTTALTVTGYVGLILHCYSQHQLLERPDWYLNFISTILITGSCVAYLVYRVRALSRFYERRPQS